MMSKSIVAIKKIRVSFGRSLSFGSRNSLSLSRSLSVVVRVSIVAPIMSKSKSIVASIQKIRVSLWIGNCLCFRFRLAQGKDGQAEKSQNPEHTADAEVGWKCPHV